MTTELPLKISKKQTVDIVKPIPETDNLLIDSSSSGLEMVRLLGVNLDTPDEAFCTLEKQFGTKARFHYRVERYDNNTALCGEMGFGRLIETPKGLALERTRPVAFADQNSSMTRVTIPQTNLIENYNDSSKLLVTCMFPERYEDIALDPHTLMYTDENSPFNPLYVKENSLVGRFKSSIRNISFTELFKKVTQLSLTQLILTTPKKPKEVEGSIVYDSKTKSLKFFDGEVWKRLVHEDT